MKAEVKAIRHKDVHGKEEPWLEVKANGRSAIVPIGSGALKRIEGVLNGTEPVFGNEEKGKANEVAK